MFNSSHYVPILKWKRAEHKALKALEEKDKAHMTPLIQLVMPKPKSTSGDFAEKTEEQFEEGINSFKEKLPGIPEEILNFWGHTVAFIDFSLLYTTDLKIESLKKILSKGNEIGLQLVPVVNLSDGPEIINVACSLAKKYNNGLCVRLVSSHFSDLSKLSAAIEGLLTSHSLNEKNVDLLVDLKDKNNEDEYLNFINLSQQLPRLINWRTFTFASGAFPVDLSGCKIDEENLIPRLDWNNWIKQTKNKQLLRHPAFADYTIQYPIYKEALQLFAPSTSIKYTLEDEWLIMKGKKGEYELYLANAKLLSEDERFFGEDFSAGDKYIVDRAQHLEKYMKNPAIKGTGSSETWISAGINHHLVCTANQIASLP